jgi:hypothetical protein
MGPPTGLEWYRSSLVYAAIFVVALAGGAARVLPHRLTLMALAVTALAGLAAAAYGYARVLVLREQADRWIRGDRTRAVSPGLLAEREHELVSSRHRHGLALGLRRIMNDAGKPFMVSARVPVDAVAVTREHEALEQLMCALDDRGTELSPRCVALVESLLTDPASPLFSSSSPACARRLSERLGQIHFELERGA